MEAGTSTLADTLARLTLFADLGRPQLESVAHLFEEEVFAEGQRVIRQGLEGSGFYIVLEGDARVVIDGVEPPQHRRVLAEVPLDGQDADLRSVLHAFDSRAGATVGSATWRQAPRPSRIPSRG